MSHITLNTPEVHAHKQVYGITRYSLDEVTAALADVKAAEAEYRGLVEQAAPLIPNLLWTGGYTATEAMIVELISNEPSYGLGSRHGGHEQYPIKSWGKAAGAYRTRSKKLRRLLQVPA